METKKSFYIFSFTILGFIIGMLVQLVFEWFYLDLLFKNFQKYSFGLNWNELIQFHYLFAVAMVAGCTLWGLAAGKYWWRQIYVLKNRRRIWGR